MSAVSDDETGGDAPKTGQKETDNYHENSLNDSLTFFFVVFIMKKVNSEMLF